MAEGSWEIGFPLGDGELRLLGEITALGSLIDAVAEGILARLVSDEDWHAVMALTQGQPISWRLERLVIANEESRRGGDNIAAWIAAARPAITHRNELVHAAWILRHEEAAVGHRSRPKGPTFEFRRTEDFVDVRDELRAVYEAGVEIGNRLHLRPE